MSDQLNKSNPPDPSGPGPEGWQWQRPAIHEESASYFWFNSTAISDAGHWLYGQFVYNYILPLLAPGKQYNRDAWFSVFDGDCLGNLDNLWLRFRVEDRSVLNEAKKVGADLCYVVAIVGQSSRGPEFIDQELRRENVLGYMGMTMLGSWAYNRKTFWKTQEEMSLVVAMRIDGCRLKKIEYGFHSDDQLRRMGFEPYSENKLC